MLNQDEITYETCGINDVNEFYKVKFAHDQTYDINNKPNYQYDILNLKQTYIYEYIKPNTKVLDFGCGSGIFKILKNINCELIGIDLSKKATLIAKEKNSYDEVFNIDIFDDQLDKYLSYFDYVISSDVFGHIEFKDKNSVIQRLKEFLKTDGVMIHGIETGDIKYQEMTQKQRYDFVSVDGHVGMESEEKTTERFKQYFDYVDTYTPYGIVNDLDEIIKQHNSYDVNYLEDKLIDYLIQKKDDIEFKDAFNISQYCTHKAFENYTNVNNFLNLYGFSFVIASDKEIKKIDSEKPEYITKSKIIKEKSKKIAIVAPSPIPFGVGGAEKLWWGILEYLNKHTNHQCELIKIPVKEDSFWNLIDSYKKFYDLDLSYFDVVFSTKYPAWAVQHNNHHIYLQHCLRGLYDTYHFSSLPKEFKTNNEKIQNILDVLDNELSTLDDVFKILYSIKDDCSIPQEIFSFPGAFIRKVIHILDNKAMKNINSFSAISDTVINRKEYFPKNTQVKKIYHPSNLTKFKSNKYEYFFTASRLDGSKRVYMIVEAYMKSNSTIPLKIAGTGPEEERLKHICKDDKRIEFLGFISDDELLEYYSNSYAVIFIPYDEDYGLITIEAMMSRKPVITFSDSGGVTEFVIENETGFIVEPNIDKLKDILDEVSKNKEKIIQIGKNARKKVEKITWENLINELLSISNGNCKKRNKVTVSSTYPFYPPRGGGQNRIYYLYKELAKYMDVEIICLVPDNETFKKTQVAPNLYEIRVPKTHEHALEELKIEEKSKIPITDIAMLYLYDKTPQYINEIKKSCNTSDYAITSHPYTYTLLKNNIDIPIIHESHNVEYNLKKQMLEDNEHNKILLKKLYEVEKECCLNSLFTTVCSIEDKMSLKQLYNIENFDSLIVPNGVDLQSVPYVSREERFKIKSKLNLNNEKIILFMGSYHLPNIEAVKEIFKFANNLKDYKFIIIGSLSKYFVNIEKPSNVGFTGIISDYEKELYLSVADIALNPMLSGSGTNLKMLDYMANGIPVISTKVGARGLDIPKNYIVETTLDKFEFYIQNIEKYVSTEKSREYTENKFSWQVISDKFKSKLLNEK